LSRYFVTAARGVEILTAKELTALGSTKTEVVPGGVYFEGNQETLYLAHIWLRTGNRIMLPLRSFPTRDPEMLYDGIAKFRWETFLKEGKTFAIDCTISGRKTPSLSHSHYAKLKVKDAIVDRMRAKTGERPNIDIEDPDISIIIYIRDGVCTLTMDATGFSLHERGYRERGVQAPLKETLAAALVDFTEWDGTKPFLDPMCGSGTLSIEAALKFCHVAPGLNHRKFAFMHWPDFNETLWKRLVTEAQDKERPLPSNLVSGYERSGVNIRTSKRNAEHAGIEPGAIHFERMDFLDFELVLPEKPGILLVNPPYGERLGQNEDLPALYKQMGDIFKQKMKGWTAYVFTGNRELAKHIGLKASRRIELFNGPIDCRLLKYELY